MFDLAKKRQMLSLTVTAILLLCAIPFIGVFFVAGKVWASLALLGINSCFLVFYFLGKKGRYYLSSYGTLSVANGATYFFASCFGPSVSIHVLFFGFVFLPHVIFGKSCPFFVRWLFTVLPIFGFFSITYLPLLAICDHLTFLPSTFVHVGANLANFLILIFVVKFIMTQNELSETHLMENEALQRTQKDQALTVAKEKSQQAELAQLTFGISHEIRNPLVAVINGAQSIQKKLRGQEGALQSPWMDGLSLDQLTVFTTNPHHAQQLFDWLVSHGYIDATGKPILNNPDVNPFYGMDSIALPEPLDVYNDKVTGVFEGVYQQVTVLDYSGRTERNCRRVVDISNRMLQYGANRGVSKQLFLKLEGFDEEMAQALFYELVQKGYVDAYGNVKPPFKEGNRLELSPRFKDFEDAIKGAMQTVPCATKERFKVEEVLEDSIKTIQSAKQESDVNYVQSFEAYEVMEADRNRLFQVFNILLTNAIEAMQKNEASRPKRIDIRTSVTEGMTAEGKMTRGVLVEIQDCGEGIEAGAMEKLRSPFYTTKKPNGGTNAGLGLSILYEIVEFHDGRVDIDSTKGEGTTFKLFFPFG